MQNVLGIYIYNADRNKWLQEDQKTWGPFSGAFEWSDAGDEAAEDLRLKISAGDTTYTMAALS